MTLETRQVEHMKSLKLNYPERMLIRFPPVVPSHPIILSVRISTRMFLKEANAKKRRRRRIDRLSNQSVFDGEHEENIFLSFSLTAHHLELGVSIA